MNADRGLRWIACAAAACSFTALVTTRQLWPGVIFTSYFVYAFISFPRNPLTRLSDTIWILINIVAVAATALYASSDLGSALIYGTVFLQAQKIVRAGKPSDYLWVFLISFFQVVLAAAITVNLSFFFVLLAFLGLAVAGMAFLTLERSRTAAENDVAGLNGVGRPISTEVKSANSGHTLCSSIPKRVILPQRYLLGAGGICIAVIFVASLFFLAVPRLAVHKVFMRLRPFDPPPITGFSDQVQAGGLVNLVKDRTLVMRAWVKVGRHHRPFRPPYLRLRGLSLNYFDGVKWSGDRWARDQEWAMNRVTPHMRFPFAFDRRNSVVVKISQDMAQTRYVFGPPFVDSVDADNPGDVRYYPALHAFRLVTPGKIWITYTVTAYTEPVPSQIEELAGAGQENPDSAGGESDRSKWTLTEEERREFTALPSRLIGRTRMQELARRLTRDARTPIERVSALSRFFRSNFKYSLESSAPRSLYFLRDFLFGSRKGHCEAFAMAMAVLCRMIDIPARVVTGFYTTEYNRYQKFFYVRQCHAHTWVEVWLDGYGWMTVDTTPPSALQSGSSPFTVFAGLGEYWDAWTMYWRRNVVDYSLSDQWEFLRKVLRFLRANVAESTFFRGLSSLSHAQSGPQTAAMAATRRRARSLVLLVLAALLLAWVLYYRVQQRHGQRGLIRGVARLADCHVDFYAKILKMLAAEGWRLRPDQTPAELAAEVAAAIPELDQFVPITSTYYRVRFSHVGLQPEERRLIERFIAQLARARKERGISRLAPGAAT